MKWILIIGTVIMGMYQFRYKLINYVSSIPALRKMMVRLTMNVPYIRRKMLGHMFQGSKNSELS
ncbi:hypothetical protein H0266_01665 [Halobacillus locisalis]|uniref:Uncharacterized protein n=1 Tax=Halobacillus locisalis TaxID=220753 RepID=A0A838CNS0_9BACI|nr:hypothetical protein [Halobacillus locisalis]MBA2173594.1 hypothetical protein [Halobacillus locisalis]